MAFYSQKPVKVEAIQLTKENIEEVLAFCDKVKAPRLTGVSPLTYIHVVTKDGDIKARKGDWIIKGIKGDFHVCKPDRFKEFYTPYYEEKEMNTQVRIEYINSLIQCLLKDNTGEIGDGYHTFNELYEHRNTLFIALCTLFESETNVTVWRTLLHSDGTSFEGWFVLGIGTKPGKQITYHLPISKWELCDFAKTLDKAPNWDGHTSEDVLQRLQQL